MCYAAVMRDSKNYVRGARDEDGNEYRFTRPVSIYRALTLVMKAREAGLPAGSVIQVLRS